MKRLHFNLAFILFWGLYGGFLFWFFAQATEWVRKIGLIS